MLYEVQIALGGAALALTVGSLKLLYALAERANAQAHLARMQAKSDYGE